MSWTSIPLVNQINNFEISWTLWYEQVLFLVTRIHFKQQYSRGSNVPPVAITKLIESYFTLRRCHVIHSKRPCCLIYRLLKEKCNFNPIPVTNRIRLHIIHNRTVKYTCVNIGNNSIGIKPRRFSSLCTVINIINNHNIKLASCCILRGTFMVINQLWHTFMQIISHFFLSFLNRPVGCYCCWCCCLAVAIDDYFFFNS